MNTFKSHPKQHIYTTFTQNKNSGIYGLSTREKWFLGEKPLDVVNQYSYLGFIFTSTMSFTRSVKPLAAKGMKATYSMMRGLKQIEGV